MSGFVDEREYYCCNCGRFLFAATVPLGITGSIRLTCQEQNCRRSQSTRVGDPPAARVDRQEWISQARAQRKARLK